MRRHSRVDAPVGLGRASGSVPWGRGSRRREREPVFPDHSSGVILQPDRLLQACLHPSPSLFLSPSLILSILVFLLLLSSVSPFLLPRCSCCHPSILYLHHSILQSSLCPAATIASSLSPPSSKFFITVCQAAQLLRPLFFPLHLSHIPTHLLHRLLCVLQTVPHSLSFSVSLHLPSFGSHPPLPCSNRAFGSACSANGMRCSLHSSWIQGGSWSAHQAGPSSTDRTEAGA